MPTVFGFASAATDNPTFNVTITATGRVTSARVHGFACFAISMS